MVANETDRSNEMSPCRYCPHRKVGCHAECEAYQAFVADNAIKNEERRNIYYTPNDADYTKRNINLRERKRRKK